MTGKHKLILKAILISFFILLILAGCGTESVSEPETPETPETPEGEVKEVVIGYTAPLSGVAAEYGQDCVNGVALAIDDINNAGGITIDGDVYKFRLEALDDQSNPTEALTNARRLKDVYDAPAIFCPVYTCISPLLGINQEDGNEWIQINYTSTPHETEYDNDLMIWIPKPYTILIDVYCDYAEEKGWETGAFIVTTGAYGDVWREKTKEVWEARGGKIAGDYPVNYYAETDFSSQITAAMRHNPDFLLIGGPSHPTALLVEQAREMGFEGGFLIIDQAKPDYIAELLGGLELLEGAIGESAIAELPFPFAKEFIDKVESNFDVLITTAEHVQNYAAMIKLARAMEKAGSVTDPYAIRRAWPDIYPVLGDEVAYEYHGITDLGRFKVLVQVQAVENGKFTENDIYTWWTDSEEEFQRVKDISKADPKKYRSFKMSERVHP